MILRLMSSGTATRNGMSREAPVAYGRSSSVKTGSSQEPLEAAVRIATKDQAIVALYFQKIYRTTRDGIDFTPNLAERTIGQDVRIAK